MPTGFQTIEDRRFHAQVLSRFFDFFSARKEFSSVKKAPFSSLNTNHQFFPRETFQLLHKTDP